MDLYNKISHDHMVSRLDYSKLDTLIQVLRQQKFTVIGPMVRDSSIVYDEIASVNDLPEGWTDEQEAGTYHLQKSESKALFDYTVGPYAWKKFLFPPRLTLLTAKKNGKELILSGEISGAGGNETKYAFFGVRPCELEAIRIQDKVFNSGEYKDPYYQSLREKLVIITVNCTKAGNTCFCASMNTGPKARDGFDLALTEILENGSHYFTIEAGSEMGKELVDVVSATQASDAENAKAQSLVAAAASQMGRSIQTEGLKDLLQSNFEHPEWGKAAARCLTCTNCTMVCPTCFCMTVEDVTDLSGDEASRNRRWDSCFTMDFSYIHGGSVRPSARARYRQWLTHKLSSWVDQFGTFGCVGCGRCITWCPVGIDITEEVNVIRQSQSSSVTI
ncbi:MAG: 4Fe-4S dicluster domain-containing protein [bacterium]